MQYLKTNVRRRPDHLRALGPTIAEYRRLARALANRYQMATAGLADDLREACRAGGRARRLVAALLWIMGLAPEGHAVRESLAPPGRALLLRLIRSSFQVLPTDPLVQYLWLEMKDVPEFDLRAHDTLYVVLNHAWGQWMVDELYMELGLEAEPSRLYGRTLEALLAGDLDEERASGFLQAYEVATWIRKTGAPAAYLMPRMEMLRFLVGKQLDYFLPELTERAQVEWLRKEVMRAARMRKVASMVPDWPDAGARTGNAMHETIERLLREKSELPDPERERCMLAIESLESYRALLVGLADRMSAEGPDYAEVRRRPSADLARLVSMLARHRRP